MTCRFLIKTLLFTLVVHWSNSLPLNGDSSSIRNACSELAVCEQGCLLNNNKPQCFCFPGYTLQKNGQSCKTTRSPRIGDQSKHNVPRSDVFPRKAKGCRGDMCRHFKFYPVDGRKTNIEFCPPNFRSIVTNGVTVCVDPSNVNNSSNPMMKETPQKRQNIHRKFNISMSEMLFKIARQNAEREFPKIPKHNSTHQNLAIIRKYNERQQKQKCQSDEVLIQTVSGVVCRKQCEHGQVVREERGIKTCVNPPYKIPDNPCPEGHRPTQTTIGIVCEKYPEAKIGNIQVGKPLCTADERLVHLQTGPVCISPKSRRPICKDGEDLVQLRKEFYCVLSKPEVKPKCRSDEEELHSDRGTECRPKVCADGLRPVKTPVGTVCQFHSQSMPAAQQQGTKQCAPGQTLLTTEDGQECWFVPDSKNREITCPPGQVLVGGSTCKDRMLISPDEVSCPLGQELVMTLDGAECQYRRSQSSDLQHIHRTLCPEGEVLTLQSDRFVCLPTTHDLTDVICNAGHVIVQGHTDILECVSEEHTNLVCEFGLVLTRTAHGYSCDQDTKTDFPVPVNNCGPGQVLVVEGNRRMCVAVENNAHLCGPGHEAVLDVSGEVLCRASTASPIETSDIFQPCSDGCLDTKCGSGLVPGPGKGCSDIETIRNMECVPECANGGSCKGGQCDCPPGLSGPACHEDVDECTRLPLDHCQFSCKNTFGSFHCVCANGFTLSPDRRTCIEEYCFPGCLNGGKCVGGKCQCADGFSGSLCQEDVNECVKYSNRCQHQCRNTYGSYVCTCPQGSRLREDKRTCQSSTCNPNCINGGRCHNNRCRCPPGYYGIICQLDIDECHVNPCEHRCVNTIGSYYCVSQDGQNPDSNKDTRLK